jgi:dicarboxylate transporter 10
MLRQGTYSTARFGLHTMLSQQWLRHTGQEKLTLGSNVACAAVAGGVAGLIGNPTEVVLVRMCADGARPASQRFAYSNALAGLSRTISGEGVNAFTRGITANVARSVLMSTSSEDHGRPS